MQNLSIEKLGGKKDRTINKTQNGAQQQKQRKQANGVTAEPSGWDHCYIIAFFIVQMEEMLHDFYVYVETCMPDPDRWLTMHADLGPMQTYC